MYMFVYHSFITFPFGWLLVLCLYKEDYLLLLFIIISLLTPIHCGFIEVFDPASIHSTHKIAYTY